MSYQLLIIFSYLPMETRRYFQIGSGYMDGQRHKARSSNGLPSIAAEIRTYELVYDSLSDASPPSTPQPRG